MANIYEEKSEPLHQLLDRARADDGATVLIPDLQRPYVWTPNQVTLLVDSLIRVWPFGTLLMWKVGQDQSQAIPHRQFWRVSDTQRGRKVPKRVRGTNLSSRAEFQSGRGSAIFILAYES
jgi:hypothetical protein